MSSLRFAAAAFLSLACAVLAQAQDRTILLKNWAAPLYWQEPAEEAGRAAKDTGAEPRAAALTPPLVFVAVTPCRVVDTRYLSGPFGPPSMAGGSARTFPVPTSPCGIPATAKAYSLNVTALPFGPLGWLTMWPAGGAFPNVSTLNAPDGQVTANAAVVPAGTAGAINVYVTNTTDLVIDVNGYYLPPSALALGAGTAAAPALTFTNDANSGVYSPSAGTVAVAASGTNRLNVNSGGISVTGNVDLSGDITKSGQKLLRTGGDSLGVGTNALSSIGGGGHTAVGIGALNSVTTAYHNTAVGTGALNAVTSGSANTAIGHAALQNTTTGTYNVAVGESAMQNTTTGSYNVALGRDSLSKATVAAFNTVVGMYAGASLLDGCCNTAVGANALYSGTKGQWNVALGNGALSQLLGGNWNTAVGFTAGSYLTAGDGNTMIGLNAGFYNTGGSYNLYLGSSGDPAAPAESNTIRIGEPFVLQQHHRAFIAAVRGRTTGAADAVPVVIDSKGQLGTASSSRRTKTAIRDMGDTTAAVMSLRPVRFQYKAHGPESPEQYGLVAEEVAEVAPDLVARGQDGEVETVFYDKVNAMLLNEVQKQHRLNEAQDRLIQSQRQELSGLLRRLAELEGLMQASKSGREE